MHLGPVSGHPPLITKDKEGLHGERFPLQGPRSRTALYLQGRCHEEQSRQQDTSVEDADLGKFA